MTTESMVTQAKKRFHVEGQTSTLGARWQIWDGERHFARFQNIADRTDADNLCDALNEGHRTAAQPEREAVAWRWRYKGEGDHPWILGSADPHYPGDSWETQPLYTALTTPAPAAADSISDEDLRWIAESKDTGSCRERIRRTLAKIAAPAVSTDEICAHNWRCSDSSLYDFKCAKCGETE